MLSGILKDIWDTQQQTLTKGLYIDCRLRSCGPEIDC